MKTTNLFLIGSLIILAGITKGNAQNNAIYPNNQTTGTNGANVAVGINPNQFTDPNAVLNVFVGPNAGRYITTGRENTFVGNVSGGLTVTTGSYNTGLGTGTLQNANGNYNIGIGYNTGNGMTGNDNIVIGRVSGNSNANSGNVFLGSYILPNGVTNNTMIFSDGGGNQRMYVHSDGRVGLGTWSSSTSLPQNRLEINSAWNVAGIVSGTAGLRFRGFTSAIVPTESATKFLTVNADGDVILRNLPSGTGGSTTNVLTNSANTITSTVNGVVATAPAVNSVSNSISGGLLTTTVNGVSSSPIALPAAGTACNLFTCDGALTGNRTVDMANNKMIFDTQSNGRIYIGDTTLTNPFTVGAGNNFPLVSIPESNYRLLVEGGVLTEKVKIALRSSTDWADYVFANNYKLMPLNEVERFVKENKHLPGIDSAEELVAKGLDVANMQAKQMEKIEELTLYVIEQNKALDKQAKEIEELKAQVKLLLNK